MISIIIPVYNAEKSLARCLNSIINQTIFSMLEVIIIDDGSTDHSPVIIDEYDKKYGSFRCIHISNQGVSNARNLGMSMATGEFIAFTDADDYVERDFFQSLLEEMEDDTDLICSGFIAEYPNMQVPRHADRKYVFDRDQALDEFLKSNLIDPNIWNKLYRKETMGQCRFDTRFRIAEDKLFLFYCIEKIKKMKVTDTCKYHYVIDDNSACRAAFTEKKLDSLIVAELISEEIHNRFDSRYPLAKSMELDVTCRVYGELYHSGVPKEYRATFNDLKNKIRAYSINKKRKYSSKKHFLAFLAARIHPRLYSFLKNDLRFQYKN